jgi:hypothetical protein
MSCQYCKGTGWFLYKEDAPSPPYREGEKLEFAKRCVCSHGFKGPYQDQQSAQN